MPRRNLLEGDIAPHLRSLALPMMWGMFAMSAFSVVDTLYISRLGTTALAALGFALPLVTFFMGICFGLTVGTTSVLSRAYGEGDMEKVRGLATDSLMLMTLLVTVSAVVGYSLIDPIFRMMGASLDIMPMIHRFMSIWYWGMPSIALLLGGNACIRATGDTHFPSAMMTLASTINICLDPFLIFGWWPFPRMELGGAALTLVIAHSISGAASLYFLIHYKQILSPRLFHENTIASWRRILHVGVPSMISNMIAPLSAAVITWMVADMGKETVAALGIATRIESLAILVFYALGAGVSIFTGQNFGAGNYGRIAEITSIAAKYSLIWGAIVAALLWTFSAQIPLLFDHHPLVIAYTQQYLRLVPISYGAMGVLITANAALNAMGRPLPATVFILLRAFVLYIPLAWVAEKYQGFAGVLIALLFTNIFIGTASYLWNKRTIA